MANIGSFKKVGSDFQGEIVTLSVQAKGVRIVAENNRSGDNAPSHRVYVPELRSEQPGRSARKRAATTFRSSSTTLRSTHRSTRTCSATRTATPTPSSGRGHARTATKTPAFPARPDRAGLLSRTAVRHTSSLGAEAALMPGLGLLTARDERWRLSSPGWSTAGPTDRTPESREPLRADRPRRWWRRRRSARAH